MLLREEMREYTRKLMKEAHEKGTPVMRPLFYEFPGDKKSWDLWEEYMYGDKYLCCPVLEPGKWKMTVYLPALSEGIKWKSFTGDMTFDGGQDIEVECPLESMPVFVKDS